MSFVKIEGRRTNLTIMVSCDGNNYYLNFVTHNSKWCKFSLVTMSRNPMIIFLVSQLTIRNMQFLVMMVVHGS